MSAGFGSLGRGGRPLRIAYGRIFHEGNAFSPLTTTRRHFEDLHFHQGDALGALCTLRGHELKGFLRQAELTGLVQAARLAGDVETVPLLSAMTVPSGPLTPEAFAWLREALRARLRAVGPVDGVYLALHGSMQVAGLDAAAEGVFLTDVREVLGDVPIAASYDLHANLSSALVDPLTVLTAYRTNPHRDLFQTGFRAGTRLIRALRGHVSPTHAWRKLPMVMGGGTTVDLLSPMRQVFAGMAALERDPRVLTAHLFMVHPFNAAPDLGWAVHVTTDGDPALADRLADELAERVFATRRVPPPPMRTPAEARALVRDARLARATGALSLVDVDDVVGAGAPGGNTHLLAEFLREPDALRVYVPLHDAAAVEACQAAPLGTFVDVVLRGMTTAGEQPAPAVHARVVARVANESGRVVRLDVGRVSIAVTERPPLTISPRFWRALGLSEWAADAIVQKNFFHYRFFYAASNRGNIPVISAGSTSVRGVCARRFDLPVWPADPVDDWRAFDQARRAPAGPAVDLPAPGP